MNFELKDFLDKEIKQNKEKSKINVFPLRCGVGKSQYVKYAVAEAAANNQGLIVITDCINRLYEYTNQNNDDLLSYIKRNLDKIAILTADTIKGEIQIIHHKPVILMTTQRYFNLDLEEISQLTKNRTTIIFDEKPFIFEVRQLTIKSLNDIATALNAGLDDTINQEDKQFLIGQWDYLSSVLIAELERNEQSNNSYKKELYFNVTNDYLLNFD